MPDKTVTKKLGIIRALIVSSFIDWALDILPDGFAGKKELALASMKFHKEINK